MKLQQASQVLQHMLFKRTKGTASPQHFVSTLTQIHLDSGGLKVVKTNGRFFGGGAAIDHTSPLRKPKNLQTTLT
ncbi:MAG: hypothetical protein IPN53_16770 [Comamonadaceae bacterium]|nr:hypothetical protein [Comamonadaceae bacterium]